MDARLQRNPDTRPAVVDGQVVWLPTLTGLLRGAPSVEGRRHRDLWSALAAAVMTDEAFDVLDTELGQGRELADVIQLDDWRRRSA